MKIAIWILTIAGLLSIRGGCRKEADLPAGKCFKGRLEVKAMCMNYTLSVLEGNIDNSKVEAQWQDPSTGRTYRNAFALANPCTFPAHINEGDTFYFTIEGPSPADCAVCLAYYPTPSKQLHIRVLSAPCTP